MGNPSDQKKSKDSSQDNETQIGQSSNDIPLHIQDTTTATPSDAEQYHDDDDRTNSESQGLLSQESFRVPDYTDDVVADLIPNDPPPLYTDHDYTQIDDTATSALTPAGINPIRMSAFQHLPHNRPAPTPFSTDTQTWDEVFLDKQLETDPEYLLSVLNYFAVFPPKLQARVHGYHLERSTNPSTASSTSNSTTSRSSDQTKVVDFDVAIDLTPYLYHNISTLEAWRTLQPAGADEKVGRGTILRKRAPGYKQAQARRVVAARAGDTEAAELDLPQPSLREWCHRFCASHRRLKVLRLQRRVAGLHAHLLRYRLEQLVRNTRYQGNLEISFPATHQHVHIYSDCWENRWRLTRWIRLLFHVTFLFIFTWPYLFFATEKYEVAVAEWRFSRKKSQPMSASGDASSHAPLEYVTVDEATIYNVWARAIERAVLDRRQCVLDHADLRRVQNQGQGNFSEARDNINQVLRAGMLASNVINRQFGWGHDC